MALLNRSSARPKLVHPPEGFDTPARANLALAIKSRDALRAGAEQIRQARQNYEAERLSPLRAAVEKANVTLGMAKAAVTTGIIESITQDNSAAPKPDAIREARLALQVASDELTAAEDAYAGLEPRREQMERDAADTDKQVQALAAEVLREHPSVRTVCGLNEEHMRGFLHTLGLIAWLNKNNVFGVRDAAGRSTSIESYSAIESVVFRQNQTPATWTVGTAKGGGIMQSAAADWQQSFNELLIDASAALPEVKSDAR